MDKNQHHVPKLGYGLSRLLGNVSEERKEKTTSPIIGLGKGLSSLLGTSENEPTVEETKKGDRNND